MNLSGICQACLCFANLDNPRLSRIITPTTDPPKALMEKSTPACPVNGACPAKGIRTDREAWGKTETPARLQLAEVRFGAAQGKGGKTAK